MRSLRAAIGRGRLPIALLSLALVGAACSSGSSSGDAGESTAAGASTPASAAASGGGETGGTLTVEGGAVTITAQNIEFDANTIEAPAGEAFTVTLQNDDSAPHNFSVYTEEGGEAIVQGEIADGGSSNDTEVPELEPGEYFFVCDLHPNMNGTLVVTEG
jgi:plastocyanin